jgi:hypothetical protein
MTVLAIHAMLLPDGQVLIHGANDKAAQGGSVYDVWNITYNLWKSWGT